jgi:hypothetical protein
MFKTIQYYMIAVSGVTATPPNPGRNSWAGWGRWYLLPFQDMSMCIAFLFSIHSAKLFTYLHVMHYPSISHYVLDPLQEGCIWKIR